MKKVFFFALFSLLIIASCNKSDKNNLPENEQKKSDIQLAKLNSVKSVLILDEKNPADFIFSLNDKNYKFSEYIKGKNVILNFWATWCPPCKAELPELLAISKEHKKRNWIVIGVMLERDDYATQKENVTKFLKEKNIDYLNIIGEPGVIEKLTVAYGGISGIPTTFFINSNGNIFNTQIGSMEKAGFEELMNIVK